MAKYNRITDEQLIQRLRSGEKEIMDYLMEKYKLNCDEVFLEFIKNESKINLLSKQSPSSLMKGQYI